MAYYRHTLMIVTEADSELAHLYHLSCFIKSAMPSISQTVAAYVQFFFIESCYNVQMVHELFVCWRGSR